MRQLGEPLRVVDPKAAARNTPKRDIYLIVLDGHPNARVVREAMGYDITPFEDSLRALGFMIPREMRSNYAQSILSIPSLLNGEHLLQLAEDAGIHEPELRPPPLSGGEQPERPLPEAPGIQVRLFPVGVVDANPAYSPIADSEFNARPVTSSSLNEVRRTELRPGGAESRRCCDICHHPRIEHAYALHYRSTGRYGEAFARCRRIPHRRSCSRTSCCPTFPIIWT